MPNLAMELSHLEKANQHIAQARALIAWTTENAEANEPTGSATETARESLATMEQTLAAFERHRALILQTIAAIRAEAASLS